MNALGGRDPLLEMTNGGFLLNLGASTIGVDNIR